MMMTDQQKVTRIFTSFRTALAHLIPVEAISDLIVEFWDWEYLLFQTVLIPWAFIRDRNILDLENLVDHLKVCNRHTRAYVRHLHALRESYLSTVSMSVLKTCKSYGERHFVAMCFLLQDGAPCSRPSCVYHLPAHCMVCFCDRPIYPVACN